jgi:hypothetical protein
MLAARQRDGRWPIRTQTASSVVRNSTSAASPSGRRKRVVWGESLRATDSAGPIEIHELEASKQAKASIGSFCSRKTQNLEKLGKILRLSFLAAIRSGRHSHGLSWLAHPGSGLIAFLFCG